MFCLLADELVNGSCWTPLNARGLMRCSRLYFSLSRRALVAIRCISSQFSFLFYVYSFGVFYFYDFFILFKALGFLSSVFPFSKSWEQRFSKLVNQATCELWAGFGNFIPKFGLWPSYDEGIALTRMAILRLEETQPDVQNSDGRITRWASSKPEPPQVWTMISTQAWCVWVNAHFIQQRG